MVALDQSPDCQFVFGKLLGETPAFHCGHDPRAPNAPPAPSRLREVWAAHRRRNKVTTCLYM
jgi:hypothetical protein